MKNVLFCIIASTIIITNFSCQKDDSFSEIINNDQAHKDTISLASQLDKGSEVEINVDSLVTVYGDLESRGEKVQIYNSWLSRTATSWVGLNIGKDELQNYNFHMEVKNGTGVASPYVYGNVNSSSWRKVRSSTTGTTKVISMTLNDILSSETHGYIGAYYSSGGTANIIIYREKKSGSGSSGSGSTNSSLTITPSYVYPSSGIANTTNFTFAVQTNPKPVSTMTAKVEFKAPDNIYYSFSMDRLTQGFYHKRKLSQGGIYSYRYVVKYNGVTKTSNWMQVQVTGGNSGGNNNSYPSINTIGGSTITGYFTDGKWDGNVNGAGNYKGYYVINTYDNYNSYNYWEISGNNFGSKANTSQVYSNNSAISFDILSWTNTSIKVRPKANYTFTYTKGLNVYIKNSGSNVGSISINAMGMIQNGRGFGQCTWEVAYQRLNAGLSIPSTAYSYTGQIDKNYTPQLYDVINWSGHTSIIVSTPVLKELNGTKTWTFNLRERNYNYEEEAITTSKSFSRTSTTVKSGIKSAASSLGVASKYYR